MASSDASPRNRALAARLGCTPEVAASLSTSGHRRSTFFPLDLDAGKGDEGRSPTSDFYDVTLTALTAGGKLPVIRVDGPYGAPAQDVFKAEGARVSVRIGDLPSHLSSLVPTRTQSRSSSVLASA